jgi:hypothetical protein
MAGFKKIHNLAGPAPGSQDGVRNEPFPYHAVRQQVFIDENVLEIDWDWFDVRGRGSLNSARIR